MCSVIKTKAGSFVQGVNNSVILEGLCVSHISGSLFTQQCVYGNTARARLQETEVRKIPLGTVMDACGKAGQWQLAVSRGWTMLDIDVP